MGGTAGLLAAYTLVLMPMLVALVRARAGFSRLLLSPAAAVPVTMVAGIVLAAAGPLLGALGLTPHGMLRSIVGGVVCAVLGYCGGRAWVQKSGAEGSHRRGAVIFDRDPDPDAGERGPRSADDRHGRPAEVRSLTLAGLPIAAEDETKHFKIVGTTGTGKSTAISEMLSAALARGDRALIADPDSGYLSRFYDAGRGDVILNPFEPDAVKWDLRKEITNDYDVEQLARSLIPDGGATDRTWTEYARTFFTAVVQQSLTAHAHEEDAVYRLITKAPTRELKVLLGGSAAGPFLEEGNERMFGSVRSITSSAVRALRYITRQRGAAFSVRRWVRDGAARANGGRGGVLFLPYKAGEIAALRSTLSAWIRIAIFEAMDRGEGDQRLWFVVDELDALGEIDGLKDALARLRKFGGRCVLGFQSISQVSGTYGRGAADTIVENCGNTLLLRCSASEQGGTSQFASRLIGQREVVHVARSMTRRPGEWLSSTTTSEQRSIEPAVMASEIERLPDLEGFLKFASIPDWRRVNLTHVDYPTVARRGPEPAPGVAGADEAAADGAVADGAVMAGRQPAAVPGEPVVGSGGPAPVTAVPPLRKRPRKTPRRKTSEDKSC